MGKEPAVYIMANKKNGTIYIGVTSDLIARVYQHKNAETPGFTTRYTCKNLVYYEQHEDMVETIAREKQLKAGSPRPSASQPREDGTWGVTKKLFYLTYKLGFKNPSALCYDHPRLC